MAGTPEIKEKISSADTEAVWKAGVYARLSVDSDERKNESINTQIQIAKEYISREDDIVLAGCYTDLGKSGTNFNRAGFERLMADVRGKKINCVIVKDFSRFGRNYIETGNYIEKIFPFMQVRFIAVADDYDSKHVIGDHERLSMNLKNIVNELYVKDIAQRVKTAKKLRQEMGSYTGGVPPYGYRTQKCGDRKVLIPELVTKDIVVWIYEMYARGSTYKEIAGELYKRKIQRPMAYRAAGEIFCTEDGILQQWPYDTLKWILTNPVYLGTLFQARTCGKAYRERKRHEVDIKNDITIVERTHEPIVSEELFYQVAQRFEKQSKYANSKGFSKRIPHREDIFKDTVYCAECGRRLIRNSVIKILSSGDRVRSYFYTCPNKRRFDSSACKCQGISLREAETIVKDVLKKEFALSNVCPKEYCRENEKAAEKKKNVIRRKAEKALREQEKLVLAGSKWYLKYREGQLSREEFLNDKEKGEKKLEQLKKLKDDLELKESVLDAESDKINQFITGLISGIEDAELNRELIQCLVKKIYVGNGQQAEIIFNYTGKERI